MCEDKTVVTNNTNISIDEVINNDWENRFMEHDLNEDSILETHSFWEQSKAQQFYFSFQDIDVEETESSKTIYINITPKIYFDTYKCYYDGHMDLDHILPDSIYSDMILPSLFEADKDDKELIRQQLVTAGFIEYNEMDNVIDKFQPMEESDDLSEEEINFIADEDLLLALSDLEDDESSNDCDN